MEHSTQTYAVAKEDMTKFRKKNQNFAHITHFEMIRKTEIVETPELNAVAD